MRYVNFIFYTVFVSLLLGIAGLLIGSMLPIPGNIEIKIVKSGSMEPNIPTGSLVVVKPAQRYSIGDVITFGADTKTQIPTTHRIIAFEGSNGETLYRTKGDANEDADTNLVARSEVIGKAVFHVPAVGFILDFARQPLGFALLIGIPAALVILEEVLTITKEVKLALRRRRSEKDGESESAEHSTHFAETRLVYLRRRAMDEIFVPMMTGPSILRTALRQHEPQHADAYGTATTLVMGLVFVSSLMSGGAGGTIAYFSDIERSIGNIFRAGSGPDFLGPVIVEEDLIDEPLQRTALTDESGVEGEVLGEATESEKGTPPVPEETPTDAETPPQAPVDSLDAPTTEPVDGESSQELENESITPPPAEEPAPEPPPADPESEMLAETPTP